VAAVAVAVVMAVAAVAVAVAEHHSLEECLQVGCQS
jgi:hypothetical protein